MNAKIITLESVDSTNEYLKKLAKQGDCENTVVIAKEQTKGKGTKNRSFISKQGGVYLSILIKPTLSGFDATSVTSLTAVAVSEAIDSICGRKSQIKWVNDVYLDNKKVGGILCESAINQNGIMDYLIVGIGVNLFRPKGDFEPEIKDIATCVFENYNADIKKLFVDKLLHLFFEYLSGIKQKTFLPKYREKSLVLGRQISVITVCGERLAKALQIDDECRLLVQFENGEEKLLNSGEVKIIF